MGIDDRFHGLSTLIRVVSTTLETSGSGFFYEKLGKPWEEHPDVRDIEGTWVVTNRHVLLPRIGGKEFVPESFTFNLRKIENGVIVWDPITLDKDELLKRAKLHPNKNVDVAVVDIQDLLNKRGENKVDIRWHAVSKDDLPQNNRSTIEVSDDIVAIGYPRGFYDEVNVFPIVKSGTIASRWGSNFNGKPYFLIDAKLFPGSSGSIVLTKPKDVYVKDGKLQHTDEKKFSFLGIYSGEPFLKEPPIESDEMTIILKPTFNVGIVWYGYLVEEILEKGVGLSV
ncbi:MAG TPA: serine protease [Nitrosopumilaceae archaeon]|nr:serine protease [Nitrosopumilaceae archaeon]